MNGNRKINNNNFGNKMIHPIFMTTFVSENDSMKGSYLGHEFDQQEIEKECLNPVLMFPLYWDRYGFSSFGYDFRLLTR